MVDLEDLRAKLDDRVAVLMMTNPNTLGLFDGQIGQIADWVHGRGGLIYLDGANMNAVLGITRPGDFGADMMHFNPHKTFSGPHGGGGPGAGPICVTDQLGAYLPAPVVAFDGQRYRLDTQRPKSIGRVRSFFGNVGVLIRAYCYIRTYGPDGLKAVSENAVLNANYLLSRVKHFLPVPQGDRCMHEFVASASRLKKEKGISAMDLAKCLLDEGFHAPTVYFPLTVPEAIMIEPTETESKETLDAFAETLFRLTEQPPDALHDAPHTTPVSRPDEVQAAQARTPMECRLIFDAPAEGAWNMALDEALLESAGRAGQGGCLRFYAWEVPTISLGYFQHCADRRTHEPSRSCPLVRRATGGGAIVHDRELTYSYTTAVGSHVGSELSALYEAFHTALVEELARRGVAARLCRAPPRRPREQEPFLCFQRRAERDVLVGDAKIAGSAQRRHRGTLLQHGSVLLRRSVSGPRTGGNCGTLVRRDRSKGTGRVLGRTGGDKLGLDASSRRGVRRRIGGGGSVSAGPIRESQLDKSQITQIVQAKPF